MIVLQGGVPLSNIRAQILTAVREHPDYSTSELVPFCPRQYSHDNLNTECLRHHLRFLMAQGKVERTSTNPSRWRVRE